MADNFTLNLRQLIFLLAIIFSFTTEKSTYAADDKLNVLLIIADDLSNDLACFGVQNVECPNINELSSKGIRFYRSYVQYTDSNASRTSFLTGLRPETTQVYSNQEPFRKKLPNVVTLPQLFKQNGYETIGLGKVFHTEESKQADIPDDTLSWDRSFIFNSKNKKADQAVVDVAEEANHPDYQLTEQAVHFLKQKHDKPFFLAVGFYRNKEELIPKQHSQFYTPDKLNFQKMPDGYKLPNKFCLPAGIKDTLTMEEKQSLIRFYYTKTTYIDAQIGRLFDALDLNELTKNTIVVFMSDHGNELGRRDCWTAQTLYEKSCRSPLIIRVPNGGGNGDVCKAIVEFTDIYPTLAEVCQLQKSPENLDGKSFAKLIRDPTQSFRDHALTILHRDKITGRSIRTEKFRYTEWNNESSELYENTADPMETKNLAEIPEFAEIKKELKQKLNPGK